IAAARSAAPSVGSATARVFGSSIRQGNTVISRRNRRENRATSGDAARSCGRLRRGKQKNPATSSAKTSADRSVTCHRSRRRFAPASALRVSNVALVRAARGYRLVPIAEAPGTGTIDGTEGLEAGYGI